MTIKQARENAEKEMKPILERIKEIDEIYTWIVDQNRRESIQVVRALQDLLEEQEEKIEQLKLICRIVGLDSKDYYERQEE